MEQLNQEQLRSILKTVRTRLLELETETKNLRRQETDLLKEIQPVQKRCETCVGRGRIDRTDMNTGRTSEWPCGDCRGTGQITEVL